LIGQETNRIKVHFDSFAQIWNKSDGFLSLLKVNDDSHDHEADQAEFEKTYYKLMSNREVVGFMGYRVHVGTPKCTSIV
jgi:hypothetical protein